MPAMLVTGGTGNLGRHVVPLLCAEGAAVRVLSRTAHSGADGIAVLRGDTVAGTGLDAAMDGADVVLHLAGGRKGDDVAARNVAAAAGRAGVAHLVLISVIGADAMPIGYFRAKAAAEEEFRACGVPYSILRAAQFHDFILTTIGAMARFPVVPAPRGLRFEPVEVAEVAARLTRIALGAPAGRVPDLAGPAVLDVPEIVGPLLRIRRRRRPTVRVPLGGAIGAAYREGRNLAGPGAARGAVTWPEYLMTRAGASARV
ncbi:MULTISPECIES: SDR family oxidoreductase [Microbacterium]|uniref:NAD-dependent epimerase/dehydratase family protein n=1 Tax=Microbacterium wangchenii TaxID=2541726 RepID=A0ABX5ST27_9MICO|nr:MULTISPECIES: NAD(P)H-binding protein [Microbacterium]MCK6064942.1 NAD(P)H-binding protein [Microbacterium sp. EYE_512]QBR88420.1 NAD-dependent epimerase/dehydratase family protein [Microbacterium wangchenii]TXK20147.1 NAD(P)H-binding protein [Microbacterium wangchenii]